MNGFCRRCRRYTNLHTHHIFAGSYRSISDRLGLTIPLCPNCHAYIHSSQGVDEMKLLQQKTQYCYMQKHGLTNEDWIKIFGKSWI